MQAPPPDSDGSPPVTKWWAHRGTMPLENTLAGVEAALAAGVDGVEVDLQVSADGVVFLFHDDDLDALSNGEGRARAREYKHLSELKVGGGHPMPTLEALLDMWPRGRTLNLELKAGGEALVCAVERALLEFPAREDIVISSFDTDMLVSAKRVGVSRALLIETPSAAWIHEEGAARLGLPWVHLEAALIDDATLARYAALNVQVGAWGATSAQEERALVERGIARIISDFRVPLS